MGGGQGEDEKARRLLILVGKYKRKKDLWELGVDGKIILT